MSDLVRPDGGPIDPAKAPELKITFATSVINNLPFGIAMQIGDGPTFTANPDQLDSLALNFIRQAMQIRMAASAYAQNVAERTMAGVDPSKLRA